MQLHSASAATWIPIFSALLVALLAGCGAGQAEPLSRSDVPPEAEQAYFVGFKFAGLPLTAVLVPPKGAGDSTSFIYGSCEASSDSGCAPPLEIQTWSICQRRPDRPRRELVRFRGALATANLRQVFAGHSTALIFGDRDLVRSVAHRLTTPERAAPAEDLRAPRLGEATCIPGRGR